MPFALATSRPPGAVLTLARGRFLGGVEEFVVFGKPNSLLLYKATSVSVSDEVENIDERLRDSLGFVHEYPVYATLKYIETVAIYDPDTGVFLRDILFLMSAKQEVSLIAFSVEPTKATRSGGITSSSAPNPESVVRVVTLYHGPIEQCLYQYALGEVNLVCSTPHSTTEGSFYSQHSGQAFTPTATSPRRNTTPFVAFGVARGELMVLDVLSALGQYLSGRGGSAAARMMDRARLYRDNVEGSRAREKAARKALFPESVWREASRRADSGRCISKSALHSSEYDIREVVFEHPLSTLAGAAAATPASGGGGGSLSMLVLFADIHGRTHLSCYALDCAPHTAATAGVAGVGVKGSRRDQEGEDGPLVDPLSEAPPFQYLQGILDGFDGVLARRGVLMTNCDPSAARVVCFADATVLVGSLLVTVVSHQSAGRGQLVASGGASAGAVVPAPAAGVATVASTTLELPSGLELAAACAVQDSSSGTPGSVVWLFFDDSSVLHLRSNADGDDLAVTPWKQKVPVAPSEAYYLGKQRFILASRFASTMLYDTASAASLTIVENAGPVFNMTVTRDRAMRPTVVAATGIGKHGGVSLVRTSVTVMEHICHTLWPLQATRTLQANRLVVITSEYGSRFFALEPATGCGAAPAGPLLGSNVKFDPTLSDAHVVLLHHQSTRDDADTYHLLDSDGFLHTASLQVCPTTPESAACIEGYSSATWELQRDATAPAHQPVGMSVQFAAKQSHVSFPHAGDATSGGAIALSDGNQVKTYRSFDDMLAGRLLLATQASAPVSCLAVVSLSDSDLCVLIGDWNRQLTVLLLSGTGSHRGGPDAMANNMNHQTSRRLVQLGAVARSIAVVDPTVMSGDASSGSPMAAHAARVVGRSIPRVFVGLMDGCYQEVSLSGLLQTDATACVGGHSNTKLQQVTTRSSGTELYSIVTPPVSVMRQPVDLVALEGRNVLLCRGPSPLLMIIREAVTPERPSYGWNCIVELTGLSLSGVVDVSCCSFHNTPCPPARRPLVFLTNYHGCHTLIVGSMPETAQKTNHLFMNMACMVTQVGHIREWEVFALSFHHRNADVIAFLPEDIMDPMWQSPLTSTNSFTMLENERCVFIEPFYLETAVPGSPTTTPVHGNDTAPSLGGQSDFVVLIGSTLVFRDEQRPRSSRLTWYFQPSDNRPSVRASRDVGGQLQCCSAIPNRPGRLALGVSGRIHIFRWSASSRTFVAEERLRIGMMVIKLIPLSEHVFERQAAGGATRGDTAVADSAAATTEGGGDGGQDGDYANASSMESHRSCLVALDAHNSATLVSVNELEGSIQILARDSQLRGIMDGILVNQVNVRGVASSAELCACDENMNFLSMKLPTRHEKVLSLTNAAETDVGSSTAEAEEGAGGRQNNSPSHTTPLPPVPTGSLVRLSVGATTHLGDLATAVARGNLSLMAVKQGDSPAPESVLQGLGTDQLIYGTTHGAIGVIMPVSIATFTVIKSLELAVLATSATPIGGFTYTSWRDTLAVGQGRGVNAALTAGHIARNRGCPLSASTTSGTSSGVCDIDVAASYLTLPSSMDQEATLKFAEVVLLRAYSNVDADGAPVMPDLSSDTYEGGLFHSPPKDEVVRRCSAALTKESLPPLPLTHDAVVAFLLQLDKTH